MLLKEILHLIHEDFKTQAKKFVEAGADEDEVDKYIAIFKKIRDIKKKEWATDNITYMDGNGDEQTITPKGTARFDIDKYPNFLELQVFVRYVSGQYPLQKGRFTSIEVNGEPVAEGDGIEIYHANSRKACVEYKGDKPYGWCISRADSENRYDTYRYMNHQPSFYFVKDIEAMKTEFEQPHTTRNFRDPWHFFVIQVTDIPSRKYYVTNANNDPGQEEMTWEQILRIKPALKKFEEAFVHHPITDQEREIKRKYHREFSDREFAQLSYEEKEIYLDVSVVDYGLTDRQFLSLPKPLKNKYIGFGIPITRDMYAILSKDRELLNRFYQVCEQKLKKRNEGSQIEFSDVELYAMLKYPNAKNTLLKDVGDWFFQECSMNDVKLTEVEEVFGREKILDYLKINSNGAISTIISIVVNWSKGDKNIVFSYIKDIKSYYPQLTVTADLLKSFLYVADGEPENKYAKLMDATKEANDGSMDILDINTVVTQFKQRQDRSGKVGVENLIRKGYELIQSGAVVVNPENRKEAWKTKEGMLDWFIFESISMSGDISTVVKTFGDDVVKKALMSAPVPANDLYFVFSRPSWSSYEAGRKSFADLIETARYIIDAIGLKKFIQLNGAEVLRILLYTSDHSVKNYTTIIGLFGEKTLNDLVNNENAASEVGWSRRNLMEFIAFTLMSAPTVRILMKLANIFKNNKTGAVFNTESEAKFAVEVMFDRLDSFVSNGHTISTEFGLVDILEILGTEFTRNLDSDQIANLFEGIKQATRYRRINTGDEPERDDVFELREYLLTVIGQLPKSLYEHIKSAKKAEAHTKYRNYFI